MTSRAPEDSPFLALSRRLFGLERRYGMALVRFDDRQWECTMLFRRGDREVQFIFEARGAFSIPFVQIRPPNPSERFSLYELLPALGEPHPDFGTSLSAEELETLMGVYADFFHAHADELLGDHGPLWAAVQRYRDRQRSSGA